MICPNCNTNMNYVMHFETKKRNGFYQCPVCYMRSNPKRLHLENFDEIREDNTCDNHNIVISHKKNNNKKANNKCTLKNR